VTANPVINNTFRNYFERFAKKCGLIKFLGVSLNQTLKTTGVMSAGAFSIDVIMIVLITIQRSRGNEQATRGCAERARQRSERKGGVGGEEDATGNRENQSRTRTPKAHAISSGWHPAALVDENVG